jgi:hypothetical protein
MAYLRNYTITSTHTFFHLCNKTLYLKFQTENGLMNKPG